MPMHYAYSIHPSVRLNVTARAGSKVMVTNALNPMNAKLITIVDWTLTVIEASANVTKDSKGTLLISAFKLESVEELCVVKTRFARLILINVHNTVSVWMVSPEIHLSTARVLHHHATLGTIVDYMLHVPLQNGKLSWMWCFFIQNFLFNSEYGQYECICHPGYHGDGYNCVEDLTCRNTPSLCDPNALCMQSGQSFACACNPGNCFSWSIKIMSWDYDIF